MYQKYPSALFQVRSSLNFNGWHSLCQVSMISVFIMNLRRWHQLTPSWRHRDRKTHSWMLLYKSLLLWLLESPPVSIKLFFLNAWVCLPSYSNRSFLVFQKFSGFSGSVSMDSTGYCLVSSYNKAGHIIDVMIDFESFWKEYRKLIKKKK